MSAETDDIVFKRQNKGRIHKDITKRVSFNEDALDEHKISELKLLHHEDFDSESKKIFIDSYREAEKSDYRNYLFKPRSDSLTAVKPPSLGSGRRPTVRKEFPPFLERGTPEGQEDQTKYCSTPNLSDVGSESGSCRNSVDLHGSDIPRIVTDKCNTSKSLLVRRFLQSIPPKQHIRKQIVKRKSNRVSCLYVKNIKCSDISDQSAVTKLIDEEISKNTRQRDALQLNPVLRTLVSSSDELIYKVYKVLKVDGSPLLAVITSDALHFLSYCQTNSNFVVENSYSFDGLVAAVVGPFSQIVIVLNHARSRFYVNTGISKCLASELICHLEVALRRWSSAQKKEFRFNVAEINDYKSINNFYDVLPESALDKGESILGQYSIWLQEDNVHVSNSPLGPQKDGYIMTKIGVGASWTPSYVCLNAGVLYVFERISLRIPKFAIPLRSPFYKGCRILNDSERPHSFELLLDENSVFHFGVADETEMMDWIQTLYSAASKASNNIADCDKKSPVINCFVTLTINQILLHQFPNKIISRALLEDVTDFKISTWPQNYFCVLEFSCREASEMGDDWILYFVSKDSFDSFCLNFTTLTSRTGMETELDDNIFLSHKSDRICAEIRTSWDSFFT